MAKIFNGTLRCADISYRRRSTSNRDLTRVLSGNSYPGIGVGGLNATLSKTRLNRGYYMAAWRYEFYLRVLEVSLTSERSELVRDTFST